MPKSFTIPEVSIELLLIFKLSGLILPVLLYYNRLKFTWIYDHAIICEPFYCTFWYVFQFLNQFLQIFRKSWNGVVVSEIMQISSASPKKQIINKNFEKYWI